MIHELGHTLGLRRGGFDDTNYKPDYHSAMNYAFQFTLVDYSHVARDNRGLDSVQLSVDGRTKRLAAQGRRLTRVVRTRGGARQVEAVALDSIGNRSQLQVIRLRGRAAG